jgi:hypothetical protein
MPIKRVVALRLSCFVYFHSYSQWNSPALLPHNAPLLPTLPHHVNSIQQILFKSYSQFLGALNIQWELAERLRTLAGLGSLDSGANISAGAMALAQALLRSRLTSKTEISSRGTLSYARTHEACGSACSPGILDSADNIVLWD